eukprot:scaffold320164_cov32-Tisochrysis_lutea.AAC.1
MERECPLSDPTEGGSGNEGFRELSKHRTFTRHAVDRMMGSELFLLCCRPTPLNYGPAMSV